MCTDRRRAGQASVEAVLVMPFLLAVFVLMDHSTRAMMLKHDVVVTARTATMNEALNDSCVGFKQSRFGLTLPGFAPADCEDDEQGASRRSNRGETVMDAMYERGVEASQTLGIDVPVLNELPQIIGDDAGGDCGDHSRELGCDTRGARRPVFVKGEWSGLYPRLDDRFGYMEADGMHGVSAIRLPSYFWNIRSRDPDDRVLRLAYDPILRDKLQGGVPGFNVFRGWFRRTDCLFRDLFPEVETDCP